jgi:tetratricopeptide (TPR) repeat protein
MVVFKYSKFCRRFLAALALLYVAPTAFTASGFVTGTRVTRNAFVADITVSFACSVEYRDHMPASRGDRLRIHVEPTAVCNGVSPQIANSRMQHRPLAADATKLIQIDYDGDTASGPTLTLVFSEDVGFDVEHDGVSNDMHIRVYLDTLTASTASTPSNSGASGTRVPPRLEAELEYVINLSSSRRTHAASDMPRLDPSSGLEIFETEVVIAGVTWYRLRIGRFRSSAEAQAEMAKFRDQYPTAWIDRARDTVASETPRPRAVKKAAAKAAETSNVFASLGLDQIDQLMADARRAMAAGELSKAVQIYTKVLRAPNHDRHAQAQEYLGLAREKNGQTAHAKAEYERYIAVYPDGEGADRVRQRLAALLASDRQIAAPAVTPGATTNEASRSRRSDWRLQTFFSQYYRRDVNQPNEQDDIVSQSALYSDINLDVRRRGQRFDFNSRLSAGYRNDFLGEGEGPGNDLRVSYAYAEFADARIGLRGRVGRQSRNTGGVLGRFDGLNLGYEVAERLSIDTVIGNPVNTASAGLDSSKRFYGASVNYGPILDDLELGLYYIQQDIEGVEDRQAVGAEFRFFGVNQSLWGLIDYDTSYSEIGSAYLQGSWRFASRLTIHGSLDRRHSPFLSTGNALIGQPVETFSELLVLMTLDEIRQLSLDRAPLTTSYTLGLSHAVSPKLQFNVDANQTTIDGTVASGGVAATPEAEYQYYSGTVVASSVFKEGDASIIGLRYSTSASTRVMSVTLDSRFPIGRAFRVNPRLRIDRREIMSDSTYEWLYTPGLRMQFRWKKNFRLELDAGKQFSRRDSDIADADRESYFINIGYQLFF